MDIIALSAPTPTMGEHDTLNFMIEQGIDRFHVRRPDASFELVRNLLNRVPKEFREKTSIHSYHDELKEIYAPCGIHHTTHSHFDSEFKGVQSKSFHSIEEIKNNKHPYYYGFLSPIFPSISKEGYHSDFVEEELKELNESSSFPLYALGGISPEKVASAKALGFAGVVLFGTVWQEVRWTRIEENVKRIVDAAKG